MDFQNFANSKYGVGLAIAVGRLFPPRLGLLLSDWIAAFLVNREDSPMVRAIKANQWVVHGKENLSPKDLKAKAKAVLRHAGRCYYDLYRSFDDTQRILNLFPNAKNLKEIVTASHSGKGVFVVAPHTSNFDLALRALSLHGLQAKLLGYADPFSGYKIQNKLRASMGMEVIPFSEPDIFSRAVETLKQGGVVATGVDRPVKRRKKSHMITFFGYPSTLPVGYIQIALAADVPLLVLGTAMRPDGKYEIMHTGLIPLERHDNRFTEVKQNVEMVIDIVTGYIKRAPTQWLMYYPVWPEVMEKLP
ncbi:MAG: Lipid A biosynthesis lauroyltransferase [Chloroflexi bacterium]|nr:Lipid A biosynthesis lauroyltransferase [Chloroflexota bacterium]